MSREKGVMAVVAGHLAIVGLGAGLQDAFSEAAHLDGGKKPIRADADEAQPRTDAAKSLLRRGEPSQWIPGVHGTQNGQVSVGVEALNESLALVIQIAGDVEAPAGQT